MQTPKQIMEQHSHLIVRLPGLSKEELIQFRKELGGVMPNDIDELLQYSAGFDYKKIGTVRFTGHEGFEFEEVFPCSVALLPDGFGNFWVVDVNPKSGSWGPVFYVCHDPPVVVVQAPELSTFLSQILDPHYSYPKNALNYVRKEAAMRIWRDDPWLTSVHDARILQDSHVSTFAKQLPDDFLIADLRSTEVGSGFSWGKAGPNAVVRRGGTDLLFGVQKTPPGLLKRFLSRK
jgi:hypothetical protein